MPAAWFAGAKKYKPAGQVYWDGTGSAWNASGGSGCLGVVAMVPIVVVADVAVEVAPDETEVAGALVTTGLALCWLLEHAPSARATTLTVMALRNMWR